MEYTDAPSSGSVDLPFRIKEISLKDRRMLWGRSGNVCARCKRKLHEDEAGLDDASLVGEECHIVAEKPNGPRGNFPLPLEQRNSFGNLILLCRICHKVIDDQVERFTVFALREMKDRHLSDFEAAQNVLTRSKQANEEVVAETIDMIDSLSHFDEWPGWTLNFMKADIIHIKKTRYEEFWVLSRSLFGRLYPDGFDVLVRGIENYALVLSDFLKVTSEHLSNHGEDFFVSDKFHKNYFPNPRYEEEFEEYRQYVYLSRDLLLELTRAGNHLIEQVRLSLNRSYRSREGLLVVEDGYFAGTSTALVKVTYGSEQFQVLYPGLEAFKTARLTRDYCCSIHSRI